MFKDSLQYSLPVGHPVFVQSDLMRAGRRVTHSDTTLKTLNLTGLKIKDADEGKAALNNNSDNNLSWFMSEP